MVDPAGVRIDEGKWFTNNVGWKFTGRKKASTAPALLRILSNAPASTNACSRFASCFRVRVNKRLLKNRKVKEVQLQDGTVVQRAKRRRKSSKMVTYTYTEKDMPEAPRFQAPCPQDTGTFSSTVRLTPHRRASQFGRRGGGASARSREPYRPKMESSSF